MIIYHKIINEELGINSVKQAKTVDNRNNYPPSYFTIAFLVWYRF